MQININGYLRGMFFFSPVVYIGCGLAFILVRHWLDDGATTCIYIYVMFKSLINHSDSDNEFDIWK